MSEQPAPGGPYTAAPGVAVAAVKPSPSESVRGLRDSPMDQSDTTEDDELTDMGRCLLCNMVGIVTCATADLVPGLLGYRYCDWFGLVPCFRAQFLTLSVPMGQHCIL